MEITPGFIIGAVLTICGGLLLFVMLARAGGMAFGFAAFTNLGNFLTSTEHRVGRRVFAIALVTTMLGVLLTFMSILGSDARRNNECTALCQEDGWESPSKGAVYSCWCQSEDDWSPEPVQMASSAGGR
jgi:hypothetical protein